VCYYDIMIEFSDVLQAANILKDRVIRTPLVYSPTLSRIAQAEVYLKLESLQMGGSFKVRGATYKLQSNLKKIQPGVIAASVGNHAQGVALAASAAGVPATIIMPVWASISKQEATRAYGAEVRLMGKSLVESIDIGRRMAQETNRIFIHPYDDEEVIAGQGTVGLEILEDLPDTDLINSPGGRRGIDRRNCPGCQGHPAGGKGSGSAGGILPLGQEGRGIGEAGGGGCRGAGLDR